MQNPLRILYRQSSDHYAYSQEFVHGFAFYLNTLSHQFEHFALIQAFSRDCLCLLNEF